MDSCIRLMRDRLRLGLGLGLEDRGLGQDLDLDLALLDLLQVFRRVLKWLQTSSKMAAF